MQSKPYLLIIIAKLLSKFGAILDCFNLFVLANICYKFAITIDSKCLTAHLGIANALVRQRHYRDAGEIYKKIIALQPTLSTVYSLGYDLARNGNLSDEFYRAMLSVIETPEIISMIKTLANAPTIYQPSKLWLYFMIFNTFQLETGGVGNFKRTVNHNYFNWTADTDVNRQFEALKNELHWSESDLLNAQLSIHFDSVAKPAEFTEIKWQRYTQFLCMLWEFSLRNDRLKLMDLIDEPILGNPVAIEYRGRKVTQDICNSVIEVNTIMEFINHNQGGKLKVMELGAGHGRVGNVLLQAVPDIQIVIVDIPPALYVSQWYLTNLFPKHRAFKFRDFNSYSDIQKEFEGSNIAFLSPAQVEHVPDRMFDLFINISSLHEMTQAQINMWFGHIDRLCTGCFYTKQYIESKNGFDDIVIRRENYPVRPHWQTLLNRINPIYPELFETIYKVH